jgi:predicted nucleotidyltransferase
MPAKRYYTGADIPMRVIRRYARQIAEKFHPEKIILFGSRAWGTPHEDSDVDLMVVMPARNELDLALKIRLALDTPFPLDLLVRKPSEWKWRLEEGESFSTEIVNKGKVLYEAADSGVGRKGRGGLPSRRRNGRRPKAVT